MARVVFSTITIRALIGYKQAWFTCNFCVLLFSWCPKWEKEGRFLNVRFDSMLGKVARLRSILSVNNSQARKFSLLSGKFSHAELLGFLLHFSKFLFLFFSCILSYICYIIYIINRLETCNYIYIYVHTGNKAHCNGQRMLNWRALCYHYRNGCIDEVSFTLLALFCFTTILAPGCTEKHMWCWDLMLQLYYPPKVESAH